MTFPVGLLEVLLYAAIGLVGIGLASLAVVFITDVRNGRLW